MVTSRICRSAAASRSSLAVFTLALTFAVACGGDSSGTSKPPADTVVDAPADVLDGGGDSLVTFDIEAQDASDAETADCPGCFGAPCTENDDCNSGFCVPGPSEAGGSVCTKTCDNECPSGFSCRPISGSGADVSFICVYDHTVYCAPCDDASDCVDPLAVNEGTRCVSAGEGLGSYCATPCKADAECPIGSACEVVSDADGESSVCRPAPIEGDPAPLCECSWWAQERRASTTCATSNPRGTCDGRRTCGDDGLGACDAVPAIAERCNGQDDDCDGQTDEDFATLGNACDSDSDPDDCELGTLACGPDGAVVCQGDRAAGAEVCNGRDDDCDGQTDEDPPDDGDPCDGEDPDDCMDDVVRCQGGVNTCVDAGAPVVELCNGQDDDCDGLTDSDDDDLVTPRCENGVGVCAAVTTPARLCERGAWDACDEAAFMANPDYQSGTETACDGLDNDCDGKADEDFQLVQLDGSVVSGVGATCGAGACAGGTTTCGANRQGIVCSGAEEAGTERCNGEDDDCDGLTDAADGDLAPAFCEKQAGVCAGTMKPPATCGPTGFISCGEGVYSAHADTYQGGMELTCDGLDNDCDAAVDEDFVTTLGNGTTLAGVGKACGVGVCSGGFTVCDADLTGAHCSSSINSHSEVCNGLDDDCDGLTDAADPDMARPLCEKQAGICAGASKAANLCVAGAWKPCGTADYDAFASDYEATKEAKCDGKDEDCDGTVDDDFDVTTADDVKVQGVGATCGTGGCSGGITRCGADGISIECSSSGSALPEVCDGNDNDCDGKTDANDDNLVRPVCSNQLGLCNGALSLPERCVAGAWGACVTADYEAHSAAYEASAEVACDGVDEDCSGLVDEDFTLTLADGVAVVGVGKSCGSGECAGGMTACGAGGAGLVCATGGAPAAEVCDGVDNDCDGLTDNVDPDLVRILCQEQKGVCIGAERPPRLCAGGVWQDCDDAAYVAKDPSYEANRETRCDGRDNDCDGSKDEDFAMTDRGGNAVSGAGASCGTGACAGGVATCNDAKNGLICPGDANVSAEVCDFADNDCDGKADAADSDLVLAPCEEARGVCSGATHLREACSGGQFSACTAGDYGRHDARYEAGSEVHCDGFDNDCDGNKDEDITSTFADGSSVTGIGKTCGAGVCSGGTTTCNAAKDGLACSGEAAIAPESCNGLDDDCDGKTDAADGSLELVLCDDQDGACAGSYRPASLCVGVDWVSCGVDIYAAHDDDFQVGVETSCDAIDNDCDNQTDEDFAFDQLDGSTIRGVGTTCGVGICAGGRLVCDVLGTGVDCPSEGRSVDELCNGDDDDCDGKVDAEDDDLEVVPCELASGVCAGSTKPKTLCHDGDWDACSAVTYSAYSADYDVAVEVRCDGKDGDCDGGTDEDFDLTLLDGRLVNGIAVGCGTGECAGGATRCNAAGNDIECSSETFASAETCNGDDDDCDGKVDATDPSLVREPCANQTGVCKDALKLPERCISGRWDACGAADYKAKAASYNAAGEVLCDGTDEDCDGSSDEDFTWVDPANVAFHIGESCGKGLCTGGTVTCSGQSAVACSTASKAVIETCDNIDQDCDGVPDDGCDDDGDDYCDITMGTSGLPEVCPHGGGDCNDQVATTYPGAAELCNNISDDCDGQTDEAFTDCLKGSCDAVGAAYAAIAVDACTTGSCVSPAAVSCGLYTCNGGGAAGDLCGTTCSSDNQCIAAAHCDQTDGKCKLDVADGTGCAEDSDCTGGHCQNNFCCASGDCCSVASNCPVGSWSTAPSCGTPSTCQGTRQDPVCNTSKMCVKSAPLADDTACTSSTQALVCPAGYPPRLCAGGADQTAPTCPTTCTNDNQCTSGYHCDGTCVPNVGDGGTCDENSDCSVGRCSNLHCCASGDCCAVAADCSDATWTEAATCDTASVCDGHRVDKVCGAGATCVKSSQVDDDSACGSGTVANTCADYNSVVCTGASNQPTAPACPTSCSNDNQCDASAHCDGTCVPDVPDGTSCDEASDCIAGHCQNGFCCGGANNDCCASATDCPAGYASAPVCNTPGLCDGTKSVATCAPATHVCGTQPGVADDRACTASTEANSCDLYPSIFCSGAVTQDPTRPTCATSCGSDANCDANAYCKAGTPKRCSADEPDGGVCSSNSQCASDHCENGFCCGHGECCARTSDCPVGTYTDPSTCSTPSDCQGTRRDPLCGTDKICVVNPATTPDDSGCGGVEANACGNYPSIVCTSGTNQTPRMCPGSCNNDSECDLAAYCDLGSHTCKPDQPAGQVCSPTVSCAAGLFCVDGVCCTTSCTGDCRRCDLSGTGTCTNATTATDPDQDCDGFDCTGTPSYYLGFTGDTCYAKGPIGDGAASCGATGQCDTRSALCTAQTAQGAATVTCDDTCQDPAPNTCTGTTAGSCVNVNAGNITCGLGVCQVTVARCVNGGDNTCTPGPSGGVEVCDGLDNDCDGKTDGADDGLVIPDCAKQKGVCAGSKTPLDRCRGVGGWDQCTDADYALPSQPQGSFYNAGSERACDAKDNDCDNATDEDFTWQGPNGTIYSGVGSQCGVGGCADAATVTVCTGGNAITCQYAAGHAPTTETCSLPGGTTRDDDCDGLLDANDPSLTLASCAKQAGVCSQASNERMDCVDGAWNACDAADYQRNASARFNSTYKADPEILCDSQDNDCDGPTDEDFTWLGPNGVTYTGAGVTCGVGHCADPATKTACTGSNAITCNYAAGHTPLANEVCNSEDDDCDGQTDKADTSMVLASCATQAGVCSGAKNDKDDCSGGVWAACDLADYDRNAVANSTRYTPTKEGTGTGTQLETCDGKDNDCDTQTDEDFAMTGLSGSTYSGVGTLCGVGLCSDDGTRTACNAARTATQCNYAIGHSALTEVCSLVSGAPQDDDCDGQLDAADPSLQLGNACANQTGVCGGSTNDASDCVAGAWRACDYSDYDRRAIARVPSTRYTYTLFNSVAVPKEGSGSGTQLTTCDGLDNDCDGPTDEDFTMQGLSGATYAGVNTLCGVGLCFDNATRTACTTDKAGTQCNYASGHTAGAESCNAVDDDCDGLLDGNDITDANLTACEKTSGVCSGSKHTRDLCQANGTWAACGASQYGIYWQSSESLCDGKDNNCNGTTDGADVLDDRPNNSNQLGACAGTLKQCSGATGFTDDYSGVPNYNGFDKPDDARIDDDCDGIDGDDATAIYVDCVTGNDGNIGSRLAPKLTIGAAITAQTAGRHLIVANRACPGALTLKNGVSIHGGYDHTGTTWTRNTGRATVSGGITVITASSITSATALDFMAIVAASATGTGASAYAVRISNSTANLVLSNLDITAGNGTNGYNGSGGSNGGTGSDGIVGDNGGDASDCCGWGGAGGSACSGTGSGGYGGRGGYGSSGGSSGYWGNGGAGGLPGGGGGGRGDQYCVSGCSDAGTGGDGNTGGTGANGGDGPGGNGTGSVFGGFWYPSFGTDGGGSGSPGSGGGGGGGGGGTDCCRDDRGAGGGGGGGGGCGGTRGYGGGGGGGSFAIWLDASSPVIRNSTIRAGTGGAGGAGGTAGSGGQGGGRGPRGTGLDNGGDGGLGGIGGWGGRGGHGGGGGGGVSYCIYKVSSAAPTLTSNACTLGLGGAAGQGPWFWGTAGTRGDTGP